MVIEILVMVLVWLLVVVIVVVMVVVLVRGWSCFVFGVGVVIGVSIVMVEVFKLVVLSCLWFDFDVFLWYLVNVFFSGYMIIGMVTVVVFFLVVFYWWCGLVVVVGAVYAVVLVVSIFEVGWHCISDALGVIFFVAGVALWVCVVLVVWWGVGLLYLFGCIWVYVLLVVVVGVGVLVFVVGGSWMICMIDRGLFNGVGVREFYDVMS